METTPSKTASQISTIGITSQDNTLTVNGKTANAVNSISGTVSNGNLKIAVNGVESGDIPLPENNTIYEADIDYIVLDDIIKEDIHLNITPLSSYKSYYYISQTSNVQMSTVFGINYLFKATGQYLTALDTDYEQFGNLISEVTADLNTLGDIHELITFMECGLDSGQYEIPISIWAEVYIDTSDVYRSVIQFNWDKNLKSISNFKLILRANAIVITTLIEPGTMVHVGPPFIKKIG